MPRLAPAPASALEPQGSRAHGGRAARASVSPGGSATRGPGLGLQAGPGRMGHRARGAAPGPRAFPGLVAAAGFLRPGPPRPVLGRRRALGMFVSQWLLSQPAASQPWGSVAGTPSSSEAVLRRSAPAPQRICTTVAGAGWGLLWRASRLPVGQRQAETQGQGSIGPGSGSRLRLGCGSFREEAGGRAAGACVPPTWAGLAWGRPCASGVPVAGEAGEQGSWCF